MIIDDHQLSWVYHVIYMIIVFSAVCFYRCSTEHHWAGRNSHVGFYMILVHDLEFCYSADLGKFWPRSKFFGSLIPFLPSSKNSDGLAVVRWSGHRPLVWPSSVIRWTHSTWKSRARSVFFVHDLLIFSETRAHDIFVGPGFDSLPLQHDYFVVQGSIPWSNCLL